MTTTDPLPYVDEHVVAVAAGPDEVWRAVLATMEGASSRLTTGYARVVGCADAGASGPRPLAEGSTVPGFRVAAAVPGRELVLTGRHRFSSYALTFRIEEVGPGRSQLRAETRAVFPGVTGGAYRLLVLRTGAHVLGVRRLLSAMRRGAEGGSG